MILLLRALEAPINGPGGLMVGPKIHTGSLVAAMHTPYATQTNPHVLEYRTSLGEISFFRCMSAAAAKRCAAGGRRQCARATGRGGAIDLHYRADKKEETYNFDIACAAKSLHLVLKATRSSGSTYDGVNTIPAVSSMACRGSGSVGVPCKGSHWIQGRPSAPPKTVAYQRRLVFLDSSGSSSHGDIQICVSNLL